jgi:hypothetical protein
MTALKPLMTRLVQDLELEGTLASEVPGTYAFPLEEGGSILISEIPHGFIFKCEVAPYPKTKEEVFSTQAMLGNLFGQGTKGAILGLTLDGATLTLTQVIDYDVEYKEFRDALEDYINSVDLWRDEVANHK